MNRLLRLFSCFAHVPGYTDAQIIHNSFHFLLLTFAEVILLPTLFATFRARKKLTVKKFRILISLELFAVWLLSAMLLTLGLMIWVTTA